MCKALHPLFGHRMAFTRIEALLPKRYGLKAEAAEMDGHYCKHTSVSMEDTQALTACSSIGTGRRNAHHKVK
jgi:hypothetical protein